MKIELSLPGEQSDTVVFAVPDEYTITVTRNDGFACSRIEAETAMRVWLDTSTHKLPRDRKEIEQHLKRLENGERMYALADAALKEAVPAAVLRHRADGTLTWALIHQIESEVRAEVSSAGKHSARLLGMLPASPAMGYPKDDRPVSFEGHDVVPSVFAAIYAEWNRVN